MDQYCSSEAFSKTYFEGATELECALSCTSKQAAESVRVFGVTTICCKRSEYVNLGFAGMTLCAEYGSCPTSGYTDQVLDQPSNFWDEFVPRSFVLDTNGGCTCFGYEPDCTPDSEPLH